MRDGLGCHVESLRDAPSPQSTCLAMPQQSDPLTNDRSRSGAVSNFISTTVLSFGSITGTLQTFIKYYKWWDGKQARTPAAQSILLCSVVYTKAAAAAVSEDNSDRFQPHQRGLMSGGG